MCIISKHLPGNYLLITKNGISDVIHWRENITSLVSQTKMYNLNWIIRQKPQKLFRDILQNNSLPKSQCHQRKPEGLFWIKEDEGNRVNNVYSCISFLTEERNLKLKLLVGGKIWTGTVHYIITENSLRSRITSSRKHIRRHIFSFNSDQAMWYKTKTNYIIQWW